MDLLRLAFRHSPNEAKDLVKKINNEDSQVVKLFEIDEINLKILLLGSKNNFLKKLHDFLVKNGNVVIVLRKK